MRHWLAVCTIVRNEARYMKEWIENHLLEGVTMFFIYDNGSTDNLREILKPFNYCTYLIDWPLHPGQKAAYADCIQRFSNTCEWLAFIDADEFLYCRDKRTVATVLNEFHYASAIAVHWLLFGSNGEIEADGKTDDGEDIPVVCRFIRRAKDVNPHVKSIVRTSCLNGVGYDVHCFDVIGDIVDEKHLHLPKHYSLDYNGTADVLAINHYHTKSKEEYKQKCLRGRADTGEVRDFESSFAAHDVNEVKDTVLRRKRHEY